MMRFLLLFCVVMLASCNNDILEERSVMVHKDSVKTYAK